VHFNPGFRQSFSYKFTNLVAHSGNNSVTHLDHQHAGLAGQGATLKGIAEQVSHLRRELDATGAGADDGKRERSMRVLRRQVWGNVIEGVDHPLSQHVGVCNLAKGNCELLRACNSGVIGNAADSEDENVIGELFTVFVDGYSPVL
jgi:hypothetical protein